MPGEIYIAGPGLARGYLGQTGLTAERFLPDPFGPAGSRMYRSGDLGRWLADGNIEFLGRNDHQVKLRGYRIELGEIEAALCACPGVREAVVQVTTDHMQLCAWLTAYQGVSLDIAHIRKQLQNSLPDYMLPSAWLILDAMPLNPNGKIDRSALPDASPAQPTLAADESMQEEISPHLQEVLMLMQSIVPGTELALHHDFFDIGFHSINLMRLVAKCRSKFGVHLSIVDTIEAQTPFRFARLIDQKLRLETA